MERMRAEVAQATPPYVPYFRKRCFGAVAGATLRASRADVCSGRRSEARPSLPVESGKDGSENPHILMWGMGGATAVLPLATAARRARA